MNPTPALGADYVKALIRVAENHGFKPSGSSGSDFKHDDGRTLTVGYQHCEWTFTHREPNGPRLFHRYLPATQTSETLNPLLEWILDD